MATIKAYTDLHQSKVLSKILPFESADMSWILVNYGDEAGSRHEPSLATYKTGSFFRDRIFPKDHTIPCWSLAALIEQLKSEIQLENKQILFLHINKDDDIDYEIRYTNSWTGEVFITEADNLVDACVAMIEKLYELKML